MSSEFPAGSFPELFKMLSSTPRLTLTVLLLSGILIAYGWRPFMFRIDSVRCLHRSETISYFNCSIMHYKNAERLSLEMKLATTLINSWLGLVVMLEQPKEPKFVLTNLTNIDGCLFMENKLDILRLLAILRKEIEKYSNLPTKCPVAKGEIFAMNNFTMSTENFPPYMPPAKMHAHGTMHLKKNAGPPDAEIFVTGRIELINRRYKFKI